MGFLELLTLLFIALKLFNFIDWSWWIVLSPVIVAFTFYTVAIVFQIFLFNRFK